MFSFVTTCTARKTLPPDMVCTMGSIKSFELPQRFDSWVAAISKSQGEQRRPIDLYCGNSWSVVRRIVEGNSGIRAWVVSAGQGLLRFDQPICSYSATFSAGEVDSVLSGIANRTSLRQWWSLLCGWREAKGESVASITGIARTYPNEPIVAAISADYLKAVTDDLSQARAVLSDPRLLIVISAGSKPKGILQENIMPADARLEGLFGKSRLSLNNKIAEWVISNFAADELRTSTVSARLEKLIHDFPPSTYPTREKSSDSAVLDFLENKLRSGQLTSYSVLLRDYRASGRACEQRRFRALFKKLLSEKIQIAA
jgi:hypothetical protein